MNMSLYNSTYSHPLTPPRAILLKQALSPFQKDLLKKQNLKVSRQCILWGTVNLVAFAVLLNDLFLMCHTSLTYMHYIEYAIFAMCSLNCVHYAFKYMKVYINNKNLEKPEVNNKFVPNLTNLDDSGCNYNNLVTNPFYKYQRDKSAESWISALSNSASPNQSLQENLMPKYRSTPKPSSRMIEQELNDEKSINEYIKDYEANEASYNMSVTEKPMNLLSFFWNHPLTNMTNEGSPMSSRCQYQLSTPPSAAPSSPNSDDQNSPMNRRSQGLDTWRRLNVDSVALTRWNENLRIWISQTILFRLIKEFKSINSSFQAQGLSDMSIGSVGLDRLRKTAQGPVVQAIPNLPIIVPFLELHSNQEYLVRRIQQLAKGGCMSEYHWNGGGSFNAKEWDASLPTDAAIVMHLTASYLDTQLLPLPNKPDIKPFTGFHFIKCTEKIPELTDKTLAIHEVSVNPPHYRVIIGLDTYEMVKGYNNLFHTILLFLYYVHKKEHGMLGRINLGKSGVNMLWILQAD